MRHICMKLLVGVSLPLVPADIIYKLGINAETVEPSREHLEDEVKIGLLDN